MLYIVSTPIGNLKDITYRAIETLRDVDLIAAEDTRRTKILLNHYEILDKKMVSYNDHNKMRRIPHLIEILKSGKDIALVSDAGTPGISDPGYNLINEAINEEICVIPIPGPSASISALVASGLPTDSFSFKGFLSKKEKKKIDAFNSIKDDTAIFYESPYRINKTLDVLNKTLPNAKVCLAREITKKFEEFIRGTPSVIISKIGDRTLKGEIVLVINNKQK
jgi:16S rRNA (cytidine1402-2'-O)-methyltransferase